MKTLKLLSFFLIVTFVSCTEENYYTTADGLGKVNVYIEGNITNEEAQEQLESEIGTQTENIYVQNTSHLTSISINAVGDLRNIIFDDSNYNLSNIKLHGKGKIDKIKIENTYNSSDIYIDGFIKANTVEIGTANLGEPITTNIICDDLIEISRSLSFSSSNTNGNSIIFNDLKFIDYNNPNDDWSYWFGKFDTVSFPKLEECSNLCLFSAFADIPLYSVLGGLKIDTLTLPSLLKVNNIYIKYGMEIQHINFPQLKECDTFYIKSYQSTVLYDNNTIQMPLLKLCNNFILNMNGVDSNAVNYYLHRFLSIQPISNKHIDLSEQYPSAPPTGQGIIDKQTLINTGNFVSTDI